MLKQRGFLLIGGGLSLVVVAALGIQAAFAANTVTLPGGEVKNPARTWSLSGVTWDTSTNRVSGGVVLTETASMSNVVAGTLSIGTYDPTGTIALSEVTVHALTATPAHNSTANTLAWTFSDFQMPQGEKFAGIYVRGGSYLRGSATHSTSTDVDMIFIHD